MKKPTLQLLALLSISLFLIKIGAPGDFALFILAGVIPHTGYVVPPTYMLLGMISLIWLVALTLLFKRTYRAHSPDASQSVIAKS
jgi:hypothetical protein